jgi:alpha-1,3-fucosyltransferase
MGGRRLAVVYAIRLVKRLPVILFSAIFLTAGYYGFYQTEHDVEVKTDNDNTNNNSKTILIWSTRNHIDLEVFFLPGIFDGCSFECLLSNERTLTALHQSDAIVFNMPPMKLVDFPIDPNRRPEQRYVFFSPEPPMLFEDKYQDKFNNLFNLTMSYRRDSDIIYSYGDLIASNYKTAVISPGRGETQKTKLVAWFVSHCLTQSRREAYFERLREYIPVDVYGDCYNNSLKCSYNDTV